MNKRDVRSAEFAMRREWAERFDSDTLRRMLREKTVHAREATAAREVLQARGEPLGLSNT